MRVGVCIVLRDGQVSHPGCIPTSLPLFSQDRLRIRCNPDEDNESVSEQICACYNIAVWQNNQFCKRVINYTRTCQAKYLSSNTPGSRFMYDILILDDFSAVHSALATFTVSSQFTVRNSDTFRILLQNYYTNTLFFPFALCRRRREGAIRGLAILE